MKRYHAALPHSVRRLLGALLVGAVLAACSGEAALPGDPLRIATADLPDPVLGEPYREPIVAVGGLRPYDVRLDDGALPPGLALQGGLLLGTPTRLGEFSFTVAVSDGSLASTFQAFDMRVVDVSVPRVSIDVPATEVRDDVTLRARVADASRLRAVRLRLRWDDPAVSPADVEDAIRSRLRDVALFWQAGEDSVAVDLAFLGRPFDGEAELFRIDLSVEEVVRLGFDLEVEAIYAGRHLYEAQRLGAPRSDGGTQPADGDPVEDDPDPSNGPDGNESDSNAAGADGS